MKNIFKCSLAIVLIFACLASFSACSPGDEAESHIIGFFAAVSEGSYLKASTYIHPSREGKADLARYFDRIERDNGVDFSDGVVIEQYTSTSTSSYDSRFKGSTCETTFSAEIGDTDADITVLLVKNNVGYGIYDLNITVYD